jgi:hypothetical protein
MSQTDIPAVLRRLVIARAGRRCEYGLIHEDDTYFGCEVDHVVSEKHGGPTVVENIAYACLVCTRYKGSDLGSILVPSGDLIRFFHPRLDAWSDHFTSEGAIIKPRSAIGQVTERIFRFNLASRGGGPLAGPEPMPRREEDRRTLAGASSGFARARRGVASPAELGRARVVTRREGRDGTIPVMPTTTKPERARTP